MMFRARIMAVIFISLSILLILIVGWGRDLFPQYSDEIVAGFFLIQLGLVAAFLIARRSFKCPNCGRSIFEKFGLPSIWPSAICAKCGAQIR